MYAYHAELYCDACGPIIAAELEAAGAVDAGDSDGFPQYGLEGEADGPNHCANGERCFDAVPLEQYGLEAGAELFGAETRSVGALIEEPLTEHGRDYLAEMLAERRPTPYQRALHRFWREAYR